MEQTSPGKPRVRGKTYYYDLWWRFCSNDNVSSQRSNPWIKLWLTQLQFQPDHQFSHLRLRSRRAEAPRTARQCWTYWWPQFKLVHFQATKINAHFLQCAQHDLPSAWKLNVSTLVSGRNLLEDPILGKNQWPTQQSQPNPKPKQLRATRITNQRAQTTADLRCILHKRHILYYPLVN